MASRASGQDFVGIELGHYRIVEKIGAGGMGEVYRAHDQHPARDVAIKVLPPGTLIDESARKHFHKEALILSQLNHPNVAFAIQLRPSSIVQSPNWANTCGDVSEMADESYFHMLPPKR